MGIKPEMSGFTQACESVVINLGFSKNDFNKNKNNNNNVPEAASEAWCSSPPRPPPLSPATCWLPYDRWRPFSKQAEPNGSERASERGGVLSAAPSPPRHLLGKVIRCWNAKARRRRRRRVQAPAPLDECGEQQRPLRLKSRRRGQR